MIKAGQEIPNKRVHTRVTTVRLKYDSLLIAILVAAFVLILSEDWI